VAKGLEDHAVGVEENNKDNRDRETSTFSVRGLNKPRAIGTGVPLPKAIIERNTFLRA
jgi:hypothetical protein